MTEALTKAQADLERATRAVERATRQQAEAQAVVDALTTPEPSGTSPEVASLAAKGIANPKSLTDDEIKTVCASALAQKADEPAEPDQPKPKGKPQ